MEFLQMFDVKTGITCNRLRMCNRLLSFSFPDISLRIADSPSLHRSRCIIIHANLLVYFLLITALSLFVVYKVPCAGIIC